MVPTTDTKQTELYKQTDKQQLIEKVIGLQKVIILQANRIREMVLHQETCVIDLEEAKAYGLEREGDVKVALKESRDLKLQLATAQTRSPSVAPTAVRTQAEQTLVVAAAVTLQSAWRGRCQRVAYNELRYAAIVMQKVTRGWLARKDASVARTAQQFFAVQPWCQRARAKRVTVPTPAPVPELPLTVGSSVQAIRDSVNGNYAKGDKGKCTTKLGNRIWIAWDHSKRTTRTGNWHNAVVVVNTGLVFFGEPVVDRPGTTVTFPS